MNSNHLNTQLITILDNLEEGIIAFDGDERLVFYNGTAATILGLRIGSRKEYRARDLFQAKNPDFLGLLREALNGKTEGSTAETAYRRGKRELMLRAHLYRTEAGFLFIIIQDVTELWWLHRKERSLARQVHRQYENLVESLRQIADSVAHEVRNPIVSIGGYANLLLRKCSQEKRDIDEIKKFLGYIRDDAERLNRIVSGVERYSDLADVRFTYQDIVPVLERVTNRARTSAAGKQIVFHGDSMKASEYFVWMDREKLEGALDDIAGRLMDACRARRRFGIVASFTPMEFALRLECDAAGMKDEDIQFIFDPFFNGSGGINLAAAQRILVLHGGLIRASRKGATGLTLRVTLPKEKRLERS
ncbi:MAG TPA: histidine kinase dimerization/phospho-acceptor domain-containing protein [Spirochaetota bacterium]|nr:histidine kinase dimerization/phospho-acceptor domain-containing protein [Spirochaetota bacterium]